MGAPVFQQLIGGVFALIMYAVIITGVFKIFKISTELEEMKALLQEIQRNTQDSLQPPAGFPAQARSSEDLLYALKAQNYSTDENPAAPAGLGESAG